MRAASFCFVGLFWRYEEWAATLPFIKIRLLVKMMTLQGVRLCVCFSFFLASLVTTTACDGGVFVGLAGVASRDGQGRARTGGGFLAR